MTQKPFISNKEYQHAVCASCPASLACVAGLTRGVYKCCQCGVTWAFVYMMNTQVKKATISQLRDRVRRIVILEAHFEVCPLRIRAEGKYGASITPYWRGIKCNACAAKHKKEKEGSRQ